MYELRRRARQGKDRGGEKGDWPRYLDIIMMSAIGADAVIFSVVALQNAFLYPGSAAQWLSVVLLLAIAVLNVIAFVVAVPRRGRALLRPSVLAAQLAVLLPLFFALWIEARSPIHNLDLLLVAVPGLLLLCAMVVVILGLSGRNRPIRSISGPWRVITALFPLAVLVQFWYQNIYRPSVEQPHVNVTGKIEELGRTGNIAHLRGTITVHNTGLAMVTFLGSMYKVMGYPVEESPSAPAGAKVEPWQAAAALDWGWPDQHHLLESSTADQLLKLDDAFTSRTPLAPGQIQSMSFTVDVDSAKIDRVRLNADLFLVTAAPGEIGLPRVCGKHGESQNLSGSTRPALRSQSVHNTSYVCVETDFRPQNVVNSLFGDRPLARVLIFLRYPNPDDMSKSLSSPYFLAGYFSGERSYPGLMSKGDLKPAQAAREHDAINAVYPAAISEVRWEHSLKVTSGP